MATALSTNVEVEVQRPRYVITTAGRSALVQEQLKRNNAIVALERRSPSLMSAIEKLCDAHYAAGEYDEVKEPAEYSSACEEAALAEGELAEAIIALLDDRERALSRSNS